MKQPTKQSQVRAVGLWNQKYPVGTKTRYWKMRKEGEPSGEGATRSEAYLSGDTAVILIDGVSGCIALSHVEAV
jgi:hypothetical protein